MREGPEFSLAVGLVLAGSLGVASPAAAQWIAFGDETATRLVGDPEVGLDDAAEKDFAWGDVDHDGDIDLVVVRKEPHTTTGRRTNVLFMNEAGVLVDRTSEFAVESDALQDFGFLSPTNDRDVALADVNGDGWLDIVTATTLSDGLPKHLSHPRVYVNKGAADGAWLGFRYETARIPQLFTSGGVPAAPRFNALAIGDVFGDDLPDLYFVDSDNGTPAGAPDLNDKLLANVAGGFFIDVSDTAMTPEMLESAMGTAAAIADMNGDGTNDIVKATALSAPSHLSIAYALGGGPFDTFDIVYSQSPQAISVADLDLDGLLDLVVTDDGTDRYLLNTGPGARGTAEFSTVAFPSSSEGFGGHSVVRDLDGDLLPDVVIADMDQDIAGCNRMVNFYRNVLLGEPFVGMVDAPPGGLGEADRTGTFDVAIFDVDGDGKDDLVLGRCAGLRIWIRDSKPGDLDGNGVVDVLDLVLLVLSWGPCPPGPVPCVGDLDGDGQVGVADLTALILGWG